MKNVLLVVALLFAVSSVALAEEAPPEGPTYTIFSKLFRGIGNIIKSPIEIPVSAFNVAADTDVFVGAVAGTVAGFVAGGERVAVGAADILTFVFPPYDRPLISYEIGKSPVVQAAIDAFPQEF